VIIGLVAPTLRILGGHAVQAARLLRAWQGDPQVCLQLIPINPPLPPLLARLERVKYVRTAIRAACYCATLLRCARKVDALHVFATSNASFFMTAAPALVAGRLLHKPVIVNYRGDSGAHLERSALARALLRSAYSRVVPSRYFQAIFQAQGLSACVVPNIADLDRFRYRARTRLAPRLVSTRNFEPIYNVSCTLRAFALVQRRYPDASLVLVGSGPLDHTLRQEARQLGLRHVRFEGAVGQEEMPRVYDAADIYVQTPLVDNMPASLIEAFASGVPVVATAVGGVPLLLEDGVHGSLVPSDDAAAVARKVGGLIEDPEGARRMAEAAARQCRRFDAATVREHWRALYRDVVEDRDGRTPVAEMCDDSRE
jgi:glycosyltransferase involved in cell wall biosynthesis